MELLDGEFYTRINLLKHVDGQESNEMNRDMPHKKEGNVIRGAIKHQ